MEYSGLAGEVVKFHPNPFFNRDQAEPRSMPPMSIRMADCLVQALSSESLLLLVLTAILQQIKRHPCMLNAEVVRLSG